MSDDAPGTYFKTPNLTSDQLSKATEAAANKAAQHDLSVEVTMRGDCRLNPTLSLTLAGTQSKFDRTYSIMQVVHRFSASGGYTTEVVAHAPSDTPSNPTSDDQTSGTTSAPQSPSLGSIGGDVP